MWLILGISFLLPLRHPPTVYPLTFDRWKMCVGYWTYSTGKSHVEILHFFTCYPLANSTLTAFQGALHTAGSAVNNNLDLRQHPGCRCPISILRRPYSESWWKTTHGTFNGFLIKQELSFCFLLGAPHLIDEDCTHPRWNMGGEDRTRDLTSRS